VTYLSGEYFREMVGSASVFDNEPEMQLPELL
jgi:hypothetical protein